MSALAPELILDAVRDMSPEQVEQFNALLRTRAPDEDYLELLTVQEGARRARCHVETIRRAIRAGSLEARRVGSTWRIPAEALDVWLAAVPSARCASPPARSRPRPSRNTSVDDAWAALDAA